MRPPCTPGGESARRSRRRRAAAARAASGTERAARTPESISGVSATGPSLAPRPCPPTTPRPCCPLPLPPALPDVVRRVSEGVRAIRPNIIITTAGIPLPKPQMSVEGRNEWIWLEKGWIDVAYNMDYGNPSVKLLATRRSLPAYADRFAEMLATYSRSPNAKDKLPGTRIVFGARTGSKNGQTYANGVEYCLRRYPSPGGVATYWYENLNKGIAKALRAGPFKENALPAWHERYLQANEKPTK